MSGWGESDARGEWYANQDFVLRNLQVQKGERLPDAWQLSQNRQYLKDTYGEDCIAYKSRAGHSAQVSQKNEEWVPVRKEKEVGKKGK